MAELRATIAELEAILADDDASCGRSSRTSWPRSATSSPRPASRDHLRRRRHRHRGPHRRRGARRHHDRPRATSRPSRPTRSAPRAAAAAASAGAKLKRRGLRHPHHPHHGPRLPAVLLQPRARCTGCKAHEIPMKERTAQGMPIVNLLPLQPDEHDPGDHRHPRLRDEPVPVLRHHARAGEEDHVHRVRLVAARPGSSPSTSATATSWCGSSRPTAATTSSWSAAQGMTIRFTEDDVRPMGRAAAGVRGMKLQAGRRGRVVRRRPRRRGAS